MIEYIAQGKGWRIKNRTGSELAIDINTDIGCIGMFFMWSAEVELLQISAIMNVSIDTMSAPAVYELLSLINEKLFMGHFSLLSGTNLPIYRNSSMINLAKNGAPEQVHDLIDLAFDETYKYFNAFKMVSEGHSAAESLACIMPQAIGRA